MYSDVIYFCILHIYIYRQTYVYTCLVYFDTFVFVVCHLSIDCCTCLTHFEYLLIAGPPTRPSARRPRARPEEQQREDDPREWMSCETIDRQSIGNSYSAQEGTITRAI